MMPAWLLLKQWDAGQPVWSWRMDGHEHHIQYMVFEMLPWFFIRPSDLQPLECMVVNSKEPPQFVSLIRRLSP
jgi:hypothetical protein